MKRIFCFMFALMLSISIAFAEEQPNLGVSPDDFIETMKSTVKSGVVVSIIENGVSYDDTSLSWKLTMHNDLKATISDGMLSSITVTGGKKGTDNMEALLLFAYSAIASNKYLGDMTDVALKVVLNAIFYHDYTLNDIRYHMDHRDSKGFTFTIAPEAAYAEQDGET